MFSAGSYISYLQTFASIDSQHLMWLNAVYIRLKIEIISEFILINDCGMCAGALFL